MFTFFASVYTADKHLGELPLFQNLSKFNEVKIKSKDFNSYSDCCDAAHALVSDVIYSLNATGEKYFVQTAFNPNTSEETPNLLGVGHLSNWGDNELFRFYIVNEDFKDSSGSLLTKFIVSILSNKQNQKGN